MKIYNYIIGAVAVVALAIGLVGVGGNNQSTLEKKVDALQASINGLAGNTDLGAVGTRFPHGISTDTTSPTDGQIRGTTLLVTATTTPSKYTYSTIYIPLTQVATTTAADPAPEGYWCNTGSPVVVNSWILDISTANDLWGGNMTFGTTTCTAATATGSCGDGTESFTATTTATIAESTYVNTSTVDFINAWNINNLFAGAGTYYDSEATGTPFMLGNGDCIVVHNDQSGATSSEGYTTAGGWATYAGHLLLNAIIR